MKKRTFIFVLILVLITPLMFVFVGCGGQNKNQIDINAKEVYAMSAISSVSYLHKIGETKSNDDNSFLKTFSFFAEEGVSSRPSNISNEDVKNIALYIKMFEGLLLEGNIGEQISAPTEEDGEFYLNYKIKMIINLPMANGKTEKFVLFYNEIPNGQENSIEPDDDELEISSTINGVMFFGENQYEISGKREFEVEGNESESSIEFTTKSKTNPSNYVVVEQEVENNEIEYEYKIYENSVKINETEVEFEIENGVSKLELQFKDINSSLGENKYEIKKVINKNNFIVTIKNSNQTFNVEPIDNELKFTYQNGFSEII